jgi:glutamate/aspartate transport system substrate-binding protein
MEIVMRFTNFLICTSLLSLTIFSETCHANTIEKMTQAQKIVIGYRATSPPFSFKSKEGLPAGYQIDLCTRIAEQLKTKLKIKQLRIEFREVTSQQRLPAIKSGEIDLECASTTITSARLKEVDFSFATYITGIRFAAKRDGKFESIRSLGGKAVGAGKGTTSEKILRSENVSTPFSRIVTTETTAFKLLEAGEVDAAFNDEPLLLTGIAKSKTPNAYEVVGKYLSVEPYGLMIRKDDAAFKNAVNTALASLFSSGEALAFHDKWFIKGEVPIPMNNMTKETFRAPSSAPAWP